MKTELQNHIAVQEHAQDMRGNKAVSDGSKNMHLITPGNEPMRRISQLTRILHRMRNGKES